LPSNSYSGNLAPHGREEEANPEKAKVSLSENLPGSNFSRHRVCGGKNSFSASAVDFTGPHKAPLKQSLSDCRCLGQTDSSRYARVWIANSGVKKIH
jgi:hypothetical protein